MLWCLIFMLAGAFIFAAGSAFERDFFADEEELSYEDETEDEASSVVLKQWENLLGYDGNEQEGYDENN